MHFRKSRRAVQTPANSGTEMIQSHDIENESAISTAVETAEQQLSAPNYSYYY